jgi:biopolymer transport protein ExbD
MKIGSPLPHKKARIEIIPLIDIMFFLLAAFMLASLSMMRLQSITMNLPTATVARRDTKPDIVNLAVDQAGNITIDKKPFSQPEVRKYLTERSRTNSHLPVYITGDENATHGTIIDVLDLVKSAGIQNVSFALATAPAGSSK